MKRNDKTQKKPKKDRQNEISGGAAGVMRERKASAPKLDPRLRAAQQMAVQYNLSPCSRDYVESLSNPFESKEGACIPVMPNIPSSKRRYWVKTIMHTGTTGYGWAYARPNPAGNTPTLFHTTTAYTGIPSNALAQSGTGILSVNGNSEFNDTNFVDPGQNTPPGTLSVSARVVSWGLRVRYRGTKLNAGGSALLFEHPEHGDLTGTNMPNIAAFSQPQRVNIPSDGSWLYVTGLPAFPFDYDYSSSDLGYEQNPSIGGVAPAWMCILLESAVPLQPFDVEVISNWELIGSAPKARTPSHYDEMGAKVGVEALRQRIGQVAGYQSNLSGDNTGKKSKGFFDKIGQFALGTLSGVIPKLLGGPVGGALKLLAS